MGAGAFIEPLVVVTLLFGGTYINRDSSYRISSRGSWGWDREKIGAGKRDDSPSKLESALYSPASDKGLLSPHSPRAASPLGDPKWRTREVALVGFRRRVTTPNTRVFRDRFLSRLLRKFPFLVEAWYWALIYWVYQLGRAFTAVTIVEGTVHVARKHAIQLIHLEKQLHLFFELPIQRFFLQRPFLLLWINRTYSFIHIPGTILFLVWLYYYTTTRNRVLEAQSHKAIGEVDGSPAGHRLYEARRRTMAMCNLIAFIVFTAWPCMPPRLLSDPKYRGAMANEAKSFGFVDTVHGKHGESSVWTQNRFCNQYGMSLKLSSHFPYMLLPNLFFNPLSHPFLQTVSIRNPPLCFCHLTPPFFARYVAAMPSLHFGYSLLIGLTIATIPLRSSPHPSSTRSRRLLRRAILVTLGTAYPLLILIAIIATANHFVLDAVAGALVCGAAWWGNGMLRNLLVVEDWFLWCVRIAKPESYGEGETRG
ncbi:hypothetical protein EV356DRAFT_524526 [Viridothelium virens]|uniref:Inositolphosphotransferase Aur1/Ipt1 domain-containing protein n=1 Tax=Viridothelium virens TaxID=1048519 RepID=A0A6A6H6Q5_VIRVR|nr:hypothetical protein EV356DRAFT_524526 [Viridothelium virens]